MVKNMKKTFYGLIALVLILTGCQTEPSLTKFDRVTLTAGFDTRIDLIAYTESESEFNEYFNLMHDEFSRYHQIFDKFHEYEDVNSLMTINQNAGIAPVVVDQAMIEVLLLIKDNATFNNNKFDPTIGAVLDVWQKYREQGMLNNQNGKPGVAPSQQELEEASLLTGWEYVEIDASKSTVFITKAGVSIDLGAIAKGWAVEQVAQTLEAAGLTHGAINAGGNIRTINNKPDGPWVVGVSRPSMISSSSVDSLTLDGSLSMVTSGDYQRFYTDEDNNILHHLVDPQTLWPGQNFRSVTIITKDSGVADFFSTVLYLATYEEGLNIINDYNEQHPDQQLGAVWVIDKDEQAPSSDFFIPLTSQGTPDEFQIAVSENYHEFSRAFQAKP